MMDLTDPAKPEFMWRQNPYETHNWSPASHTFMVPKGSDFGFLLTETHTTNCAHPPAFATFFDMRNHLHPISISTFNPYPMDPVTMRPVDSSWCQQGARYGAHNTWQWMEADDLLHLTNAGLRILDGRIPSSRRRWATTFRPGTMSASVPRRTNLRGSGNRPHLHQRPVGAGSSYSGVHRLISGLQRAAFEERTCSEWASIYTSRRATTGPT